MDKKIISLMLAIFLIGVVTAGIGITRNITLDVKDTTKTYLDDVGFEDIKHSQCISINADYCEFRIYDEDGGLIFPLGSPRIKTRYCSEFDQVCYKRNRTCVWEGENQTCVYDGCLEYMDVSCLEYEDYSQNYIEDAMDGKMQEYLDKFADVQIKRNLDSNSVVGVVKGNDGVITTKGLG